MAELSLVQGARPYTRVMGIDLGTRKVSYGISLLGADDSFELLYSHTDEQPLAYPRHENLATLSNFIYASVLDESASVIAIEDVLVGNNRKYSLQLAEVKGAVMAGIGELVYESDITVVLINQSTWKKDVLGNGRSNKDDVNSYLESEFPRYYAQCGNQDERDAGCIALAGARLLVDQSDAS